MLLGLSLCVEIHFFPNIYIYFSICECHILFNTVVESISVEVLPSNQYVISPGFFISSIRFWGKFLIVSWQFLPSIIGNAYTYPLGFCLLFTILGKVYKFIHLIFEANDLMFKDTSLRIYIIHLSILHL